MFHLQYLHANYLNPHWTWDPTLQYPHTNFKHTFIGWLVGPRGQVVNSWVGDLKVGEKTSSKENSKKDQQRSTTHIQPLDEKPPHLMDRIPNLCASGCCLLWSSQCCSQQLFIVPFLILMILVIIEDEYKDPLASWQAHEECYSYVEFVI